MTTWTEKFRKFTSSHPRWSTAGQRAKISFVFDATRVIAAVISKRTKIICEI